MTNVVNSFALLGDEEEDDVTVLVEHFTKKVGVTAAVKAKKSKKKPPQDQSQQVSSEKEKGKGHGGQGRGSGRDGVGRKQGQFGNEQENGYRRKYAERSNGNGYGTERSKGNGYGTERSNGNGYVTERSNGNGYVNAYRGRGGNRRREGNRKTTGVDSDGWQQVGHGNKNYDGERRGYEDGNHGHGGRRDGIDNAGGEQVNSNEVKENVAGAEAVVNVESNIAISEGEASPVTVEPTEVKAEEKTPEGSGKSEGRFKADKPFKKFEKEDEKLMTLEEYQKVIAEKRKALEPLKNEERKVVVDKDFEVMEMIAKKKKEEDLLKPDTAKLKKKDILEKDDKSRKTVSINEFLKPADGEKFFYRRPGRGRVNGGVSGHFRNGDRAERGGGFRNQDPSQQGGFRNRDPSQQGGFSIVNRAEQGGGFMNRDPSQQGGYSNVNRSEQGGYRNQDRSQQGGYRNVNRSEQGGFRNRDGSQQGGFSNVNRAEQGEFKSKDRAEQGEPKSKDRAEQGGFKNNVYPREGGIAEDKPVIKIEDQIQFPVLKGTAPAV